MGLIDKMMGPRRDDPAVVAFVEADRAMTADPHDVAAAERFVEATKALPLPVAQQLRREAGR